MTGFWFTIHTEIKKEEDISIAAARTFPPNLMARALPLPLSHWIMSLPP